MDRYEEALARAKQGLPIDQVFPELAESDGERIRKFLIEKFSKLGELWPEYSTKTILDWLEKQKEQKSERINITEMVAKYRATDEYVEGDYKGKPVNCMVRAYERGIRDTLLKVKEQKPVACENDFVSKPKTSLEILKHYLIWAENSEEDCPYTWKELAAAIKDAIAALEQKPVEWSDKDKNAVNNLVGICTAAKTYRHFAGCRPEEITELQNWLKDLEQMK